MIDDRLQAILEANGGIVKVSQAKVDGISHTSILRAVQAGRLKRVAHGVYEAVDKLAEYELAEDRLDDKLYISQLRRPKAIYSHDTALYLNNMIDRDPSVFSVTVPTGYNTKRLVEDGFTVFSIQDSLYELGIVNVQTKYGHPVMTYSPERAICDCIRSRSRVDVEVMIEGLKGYVQNRNYNRNVYLLMEMAKAFGVQKILRTYLEVLL